jgi:hypothetical protein
MISIQSDKKPAGSARHLRDERTKIPFYRPLMSGNSRLRTPASDHADRLNQISMSAIPKSARFVR